MQKLAVLTPLLFCGCIKEYVEVPIPIKCEIPAREKPQWKANALTYLKDVLVYTEKIEADLDFCRGN